MSVPCVLTTCSNKAAGGCVFQNKAAGCILKRSRYDQLPCNNTLKMRPFSAAKMVVPDGIGAASCVGNGGFSITSNYNYDSSGNNNNKNNYNYYNNDRISVVDSCLVIPPKGAKKKKVRAIIKFLGGAFIGAIPHVSYRYLLELLANEGFLVVCVPYNVTFDHAQATNEVYQRFNSCLDTLFTSGLPLANLSHSQILQLPLFSVGHSNGALLQVLAGSYFSEKIPKANAIISFNNRPATEAVPYFEQLGPLVSQMMPIVEESPVLSVARSISDDAWKMFLGTAGTMMRNNQDVLDSFTQFVDQLPLVFNQVTQGVSEFRPTPSENLDRFRCSYNVQHTLLVKFKVDAIDQTDLLEDALRKRLDATSLMLEKVELSGNHITPCIQEPKWPVGSLYTPADAIAQGLRSVSLRDTRVLSRTISDWFRQFEN